MLMNKSMAEYDIFVPLCDEAGKQYPRRTITEFRQLLVTRFGGLTDFNHRSKGFWKIGAVTFRDGIVLWRVVCSVSGSNNRFFIALKRDMQKRLHQKEILIARRRIILIDQ
jgi:hypothetical protein